MMINHRIFGVDGSMFNVQSFHMLLWVKHVKIPMEKRWDSKVQRVEYHP